MVPNGWEKYIGSEITSKITKGSSPKWQGFDYQDSGTLFVTSENVRDGYLDVSKPKYLPIEFNQKLKNSQLKSGDILINIVGASIGRSCQYNIDNQQANINQAVCLFRTNELVESNYIHQFLQLPSTVNRLLGTQTDSARPNLSLSDMREFTFAVPPLPEQRKIAQILSTCDRGIATTEKLIDASKQQKKALMQQLLTGKKRLVDPETGKAFEGEWEEVKLGDLGKTFTGLTGKTKEHFGRGSKYIPYINIFRNSSVDMNALELVDVRPSEKQNLVKYGDIFFTTSSETPEEVGMSSVILEEVDESVYLNSFCFGFRPHNFNRVKPEFIRYLLRSEKVRRSISLLAQGATRYNLSKTQLLKITLNIPSLGEQQKIASVLTTADKDIELLEVKLAYFKQEKKALMQQLLTGKRRVKVAETEAA
jgi:type I restriction enzyme S subunit